MDVFLNGKPVKLNAPKLGDKPRFLEGAFQKHFGMTPKEFDSAIKNAIDVAAKNMLENLNRTIK